MSVAFPRVSTLSDCDRVRESARRAGFPALALPIIVAISKAETGGTCSPRATCANCTPGINEFSVGPFQLNLRAHGGWLTEACARDFDCAARAALRISGGKNFTPWTVFRTGTYRKYLEPAETALTPLFPPTGPRGSSQPFRMAQAGIWSGPLVWVAAGVLLIVALAGMRGGRK